MGLQANLTLPNGFTATYFRIKRAVVENPKGAVLLVQGFKDQAKRETPDANLSTLVVYEKTFYLIPEEGGKKTGEMNYSDFYQLLRQTTKEFADSTDC